MKPAALLRIFFVLGLLLLCVVLFMLYAMPALSLPVSASQKSLRVIALNIISGLFLIAFLEKQPNNILRVIFISFSFVVLIESILLLQFPD
ncbi:MAG: hypothetical protein M1269_09745 [Chloroflexi bacterium]|nr:hypothetical protein [Chloroflexota bacterium]